MLNTYIRCSVCPYPILYVVSGFIISQLFYAYCCQTRFQMLFLWYKSNNRCHNWNRNCVPFWITWVHYQILVGCVDKSLFVYVVFCRSLFSLCPFCFGHCIVCPSSIYGVCWPPMAPLNLDKTFDNALRH